MLCQNRSNSQTNFRGYVPGFFEMRSPIKIRGTHIPMWIESDFTDPLAVTQQSLAANWPSMGRIFRDSGNRRMSPLFEYHDKFESFRDYDSLREPVEWLKCLLSCDPCGCGNSRPLYGQSGIFCDVFKRQLKNLQDAWDFGGPQTVEGEIDDSLELFQGLGSILEEDGLGPSLFPRVVSMAMEFLPYIAPFGPRGIFRIIRSIYKMSRQSTEGIRKLIQDLRPGEAHELYHLAFILTESSENILAYKVIRILNNEPHLTG